MALQARLYFDARDAERRDVELGATIRDADARPVDVSITNLSRSGFAVEAAIDLAVGDPFRIGVSGVGIRPAAVVWRSDQLYGCTFTSPLSADEFEKALAAGNVVSGNFGRGFDMTSEADSEAETSRLAAPAEVPAKAGPQTEAESPTHKLSRPLRLAIILGLAIGLWALIILAALGLRALF